MADVLVAESPSDELEFGPYGPVAGRNFTVVAGSKIQALNLLRTAKGVKLGSPFEDDQGEIVDPYLLCQFLSAYPTDGAYTGGDGMYTCRARYAYPRNNLPPPLTLNGSPRLYVEDSETLERIEVDLDGSAIVNTAGVPFDGGLEVFRVSEVLVAEWLTTAVSDLTLFVKLRKYRNKLNSTTFFGAPMGCVRCLPLKAREQQAPATVPNGTKVFKVEARFSYRPPVKLPNFVERPGWEPFVLDVGRQELIEVPPGSGNKILEPIRGRDKQPVSDDVPLLNGKAAPPPIGNPPIYPGGVLKFRRYDLVDLNELLPASTPQPPPQPDP